MPLTTYLANKFGDHLRGTSYTAPSTIYLAAFTSPTTDAGGGTEVTGGSYARVAITLAAFVSKVSSNSVAITFPQATANWGTITHFAVFDASSGGNMLWHNAALAPDAINNGGTLTVPVGDLNVLFN